MKIEEKFEDALYGEMYGLIYFFIEEMSGGRGEEEIRKICRQIYNNRKKLGLFTLDDIEIDEEKIANEIFDYVGLGISSDGVDELTKAIVDEKPIKVKK